MTLFHKQNFLVLILSIFSLQVIGEGQSLKSPQRLRTEFDRTGVIERAHEIARSLRFETSAWPARVSTRIIKADQLLLSNATESPSLHFLSPFLYQVYLFDDKSNDSILIEMTSSGVLRRFEFQRSKSAEVSSRSTVLPRHFEPAYPELLDQRTSTTRHVVERTHILTLNEQILKQLFYQTTSLSDAQFDAAKALHIYRLPEVEMDGMVMMRPSIHIKMNDGRTERVEFQPSITTELRRKVGPGGDQMERSWRVVSLLLVLPMTLVAAIFGLIAIAFRQLQARKGLPLWIALFVMMLTFEISGSRADAILTELSISLRGQLPGISGSVLPFLVYLTLLVITSFVGYAIYITGQSISIRSSRRSLGLELLIGRSFLTAPVVEEIIYGILGGAILAIIPFILMKTGMRNELPVDLSFGLEALAGRYPVLASFSFHHLAPFFIFFAIICPLIELYIKHPSYRWLIIFGVSIPLAWISISSGSLMIGALLTAVLLVQIYSRFNLLGVMVCLVMSDVLNRGMILLAQPAPSLNKSGLRVILIYLAMVIGGLIAMRFRRAPTIEELRLPTRLIEQTIERERLRADFDVARRAQQILLPGQWPDVELYDISAICIPSREVGGDLYDFIQGSMNQVWIVVADVSGKGVPAALYMTLTKGLLTALTQRVINPLEALRKINLQLYEVCRRKVFVTMLLGQLDPTNHRLTVGRAGHNPAILHCAATGETTLINPRGIGLGLCSSNQFDETLEPEMIDIDRHDIVVLYSDGITEAMDSRNEEFGIQRLIRVVEDTCNQSAADIQAAILSTISEFLGALPPQDDQTLVILKRR